VFDFGLDSHAYLSQEFGGVGYYSLRAQVPSPYVNILCTNVNRADLQGLIYEAQVNGQLKSSDLYGNKSQLFVNAFDWYKYASVKSPLDSIFNWDDENKRPSKWLLYSYENQLFNKTQCSIDTRLNHKQ
jgi:hypothetical protein